MVSRESSWRCGLAWWGTVADVWALKLLVAAAHCNQEALCLKGAHIYPGREHILCRLKTLPNVDKDQGLCKYNNNIRHNPERFIPRII